MNEIGMNETIRKFGHPATLIGETEHWVVLLRPAQLTLGSLVVAAKSHATAFGALPAAAHADLAAVTRRVEVMLREAVDYQRINWLMLMMVDPNVHFHVFPRHEGTRSFGGLTLPDPSWPGPPDLKAAAALEPAQIGTLRDRLAAIWRKTA